MKSKNALSIMAISIVVVAVVALIIWLTRTPESYATLRRIGGIPLPLGKKAGARLASRIAKRRESRNKYSGIRYQQHKKRYNPHQS